MVWGSQSKQPDEGHVPNGTSDALRRRVTPVFLNRKVLEFLEVTGRAELAVLFSELASLSVRW